MPLQRVSTTASEYEIPFHSVSGSLQVACCGFGSRGQSIALIRLGFNFNTVTGCGFILSSIDTAVYERNIDTGFKKQKSYRL